MYLLQKLTKITDALENEREFEYDGLGRLLDSEDLHDPEDYSFGSYSYNHDDSGNMTSKTDPENRTVNYAYDDLNRVLTEDFTGKAGTEISYGYDNCPDGIGRLCTATSTDAVTAYEYDSLGLIQTENKIINASAYRTTYGYDRRATAP